MQTLSAVNLNEVAGGDIVDVIDGACGAIGVGSALAVGMTVPPAFAVTVAFCAGWGLGRLFS